MWNTQVFQESLFIVVNPHGFFRHLSKIELNWVCSKHANHREQLRVSYQNCFQESKSKGTAKVSGPILAKFQRITPLPDPNSIEKEFSQTSSSCQTAGGLGTFPPLRASLYTCAQALKKNVQDVPLLKTLNYFSFPSSSSSSSSLLEKFQICFFKTSQCLLEHLGLWARVFLLVQWADSWGGMTMVMTKA